MATKVNRGTNYSALRNRLASGNPITRAREQEKTWCACGTKDVSRGIRQERLARKHWKIHDWGQCVEIVNGEKVWSKNRGTQCKTQ